MIAAPLTAFLIGLSIIPISTHFKQQPPMPAQSSPVQPPTEIAAFHYTVKSTDCLELIAYRFYGDRKMWEKIYEANKDKMGNPNKLSTGQIIAVPIKD
jgi:nucleoid-associated protein YgaU